VYVFLVRAVTEYRWGGSRNLTFMRHTFLVKNGYNRCTFTEVIANLKLGYHFFGPLFHSFLTAVDRWRHQCCPMTTWQVIGRRPYCYQCSETGRWSGCNLHQLSSNCLITHLALAINPKSSTRRSSLRLSRSKGLMLLTSVRYRTYRFYRSSWTPS